MNEVELKGRTKRFALEVIRLFSELPRGTAGEVIGKQILRSATSVGANYRAACRGRSRADFAAKMGIVIEEADETAYWLEIIQEAGLIPLERLASLRQEADELTAIFVAARKTTITNTQSKISNRKP
jgi:four helix bundle protein